jgi:hypothetical protein
VNASDYLEHLQQLEMQSREAYRGSGRSPLPRHDQRALATAYEKIWREVESDPFMHSVRYLNDTVVSPFMNALPANVQGTLKDIPVGVLPIRALNAHCIKSPDGAPIVVFNPGLLSMISYYMETQLDALYVGEHVPTALEKHFDESYHFLIDYFESQGRTSRPRTGLPKTPEGMTLMSATAIGAEVFVVAHALAHAYAGHLDRSAVRPVTFGSGHVEHVEFFQNSEDQEIEADVIGWKMFQHAREGVPLLGRVDAALAESAVFTFLLVSVLIEQNTDPEGYAHHPPARARLEGLVRAVVPSSKDVDALLEIASTFPTFS